jgi:hypothetical protein
MTDNKIVKALECCKSRECGECPRLYNDFPDSHECKADLMEKVYNLIDRQKAEVERLKAYNHNLLSANVGMSCNWLDEIKKAKSEAVREFAKEFVADLSHMLTYDKDYIKAKIFNLVETKEKEMVGDE